MFKALMLHREELKRLRKSLDEAISLEEMRLVKDRYYEGYEKGLFACQEILESVKKSLTKKEPTLAELKAGYYIEQALGRIERLKNE